MNEFTWRATGYSILAFMFVLSLAAVSLIVFVAPHGVPFLTTIFIATDFIGMVLCILLFIILVNDNLRDRGAFLYAFLVVIVFSMMFTAIIEMSLVVLDGYDVFVLATEYVAVALSLLLVLVLWYYLANAADHHGPLMNVFRNLINIIFVAGLVYLCLNVVYNHLFYLNPDGTVQYTYGYVGPLVMSFFMGTICFATVLIYMDGIRKRAAMGAYVALPFLALAIGYYLGGNGFIYIASLMAIIIDYSNVYVRRRQELVKKDAKLLLQRADILISQIQPHFLYNALTSIMNIKDNPPETRDAIADFGKYLRGNLDTLKQKGPIPMRMEMNHIETFSELVKINSGEDLVIRMEATDSNFLIPALTVQTVLEYLIELGFGMKHREGNITIHIYDSDTGHFVMIEDDQGLVRKCFDMSKGSMTTLGLSAVEIRLRDMVGGTLTFNSLEDDIVVLVSIPKKGVRNGQITASP